MAQQRQQLTIVVLKNVVGFVRFRIVQLNGFPPIVKALQARARIMFEKRRVAGAAVQCGALIAH